jgi:hypothetical protein
MWYFGMVAHSVHSVIQSCLYDHTWRTRIYVGVNAFRAIFPVNVMERECLTMVSSPLIDRTLATIGEVAFAEHLAASLGRPSPIMFYCALAQVYCWLGTLTKNNMYHVAEEYLWMLIGAAYYYYSPIPSAKTVAVLYCIYMLTTVIPSYFFRESYTVPWQLGALDVQDCMIVSDSTWGYEKWWRMAYFVGTSRISMYLDEMY